MTNAELRSFIDVARALRQTDSASLEAWTLELEEALDIALTELEARLPKETVVPVDRVLELYNELLARPGLLARARMTDKRKGWLVQRWNEDKERQSFQWWEAFFKRVARSKFLTGRRTGRGYSNAAWRCDFEWLINKSNIVKVIEGRYDEINTGETAQDEFLAGIAHESRNRSGR